MLCGDHFARLEILLAMLLASGWASRNDLAVFVGVVFETLCVEFKFDSFEEPNRERFVRMGCLCGCCVRDLVRGLQLRFV